MSGNRLSMSLCVDSGSRGRPSPPEPSLEHGCRRRMQEGHLPSASGMSLGIGLWENRRPRPGGRTARLEPSGAELADHRGNYP